jgi:erythrocyte band 7 integral membrane protein
LFISGGAKGPGIFFVIPCTDSYQKVDLRTVSFDVPPQEVRKTESIAFQTKKLEKRIKN